MDVSKYRRESDGVYIGPGGEKYIVDEIDGIKGNIKTASKMIAAYDRLKDKDDWTGDDPDELRKGLASDQRELEILTALKAAEQPYGSRAWFG